MSHRRPRAHLIEQLEQRRLLSVTLPGSTSFKGVHYDPDVPATNVFPPDQSIAVDGSTLVTATNATIDWYSESGSSHGSQDVNTFWGDLALHEITDPVVTFDKASHEYVLEMCTFQLGNSETHVPGDSRLLIACSTNPTIGWYKTSIDTNTAAVDSDNITIIDYAKMAIAGDNIFIEGNKYVLLPSGSQDGSGGIPTLFVLQKSDLYTQADYINRSVVALDVGGEPVQPLGGSLPFQGDYLVSRDYITKVTTGFAASITSMDSHPINIPIPWGQDQANPDGTTDSTSLVSFVPAARPVWRNGSLYDAEIISPETTTLSDPADYEQPTAIWEQFDVTTWPSSTSAPFSAVDWGLVGGETIPTDTTSPSGHTHAWIIDPAISVNASGDIALGFDAVGPNIYEGAYYTVHRASDPAGYMSDPITLAATHTSTGEIRWGDYSDISIDPKDDNTFWFFNEYVQQYPDPSPGAYATMIGSYSDALVISPADGQTIRLNPTDSTDLQVLSGGTVTNDVPISSFDRIVGVFSNGTFTIDMTYGSPIPSHGIGFTGGVGRLKIIGTSGNDAATLTTSTFTIGGRQITLSGVSFVEFDGQAGNDTLTIDESQAATASIITFAGGAGTNDLIILGSALNDTLTVDDTNSQYQAHFLRGSGFADAPFVLSGVSEIDYATGGAGHDAVSVAGSTPVGLMAVSAAGPNPLYFSSLSVAAGAKVTALAASSHANRSVLVVDAGGLSIDPAGTLDLNGNDLVLRNGGSSGELATRDLIASGYDAGGWDGHGLISTAAKGSLSGSSGFTTLGYGQALDFVTYGTGTGQVLFDGVAYNASDIYVKYTYAGDGDLNGMVNNDDYASVDAFKGTTNAIWAMGDYDYSTVVTNDDYGPVDANIWSGTGLHGNTLPQL